jgi:glutamate synthase (NADPH/NADH) small chain
VTCHPRRRPPGCPPGHDLPPAVQPGAAGRPRRQPDRCRRQAGRHHRRWRHRGRLLGTAHRQGAARSTSSRSCPVRPTSGPTPPRGRSGRCMFPDHLRPRGRRRAGSTRSLPGFIGDDARATWSAACAATKSSRAGRRPADLRRSWREPTSSYPASWSSEPPWVKPGCSRQLGVALDGRGNVARDKRGGRPTHDDVFALRRHVPVPGGVTSWAIAAGRSPTAAVDTHLMGATLLPARSSLTTGPDLMVPGPDGDPGTRAADRVSGRH